MTMFRFFFAFSIVTASASAMAEDCNSKHTTAEISECLSANAADAWSDVDQHLQKAVDAAKKAAKCQLKRDYSREIRETQKLWKAWASKECELEGLTPGTQAPIVGGACSENAAHDRIEALDTIAENLRSFCEESQ